MSGKAIQDRKILLLFQEDFVLVIHLDILGWLHHGREVLDGFGDIEPPDNLLIVHLVNVPVYEIVVLVKVLSGELPLPDHLVRDLAQHVHEELEHVVVGAAREEDSSCEELVKRAPNGPHVHCCPVRKSQD